MAERSIQSVHAREILDSRGFPTVQTEVRLDGGALGRADVACGKSTGRNEAVELRDGEDRFHGRGVRRAIAIIKEIIEPALIGRDATQQRAIDRLMIDELDGTPKKTVLGSNATTSVSLAVARAAAEACDLPLYRYINLAAHVLPVPLVNLIGGGKLGSSDLEIQEFHIVPWGATSMMHALQIATEVREALGELVLADYGKQALNVGDEGGFMPALSSVAEGLQLLCKAVDAAGHAIGMGYSLDCAASHFYDSSSDVYSLGGKTYTPAELIDLYVALCKEFPIVSIEDPLHEEDWEGFAEITRRTGIQIVGDDLFATHASRVLRGIESQSANALLWKVNQVGTLTEAIEAATLAAQHGMAVQVSERSGETEDPMIADACVALNAGQIKTGAPVRGERTSKYNRLLQIEEELGTQATYAGKDLRCPIRGAVPLAE